MAVHAAADRHSSHTRHHPQVTDRHHQSPLPAQAKTAQGEYSSSTRQMFIIIISYVFIFGTHGQRDLTIFLVFIFGAHGKGDLISIFEFIFGTHGLIILFVFIFGTHGQGDFIILFLCSFLEHMASEISSSHLCSFLEHMVSEISPSNLCSFLEHMAWDFEICNFDYRHFFKKSLKFLKIAVIVSLH